MSDLFDKDNCSDVIDFYGGLCLLLHNIPITKSMVYKISGAHVKWFTNLLNDRSWQVIVSEKSSLARASSGLSRI